jgi:hypothetical protein
MDKVRIKMPLRYYGIIAQILSQLTIDRMDLNGIIMSASIEEMRKVFKRVVFLNEGENLDKEILKSFDETDCLCFYVHFNGLTCFTGYDRVVVRHICSQIEKKLFKSGKYVLQQNLFNS